MASPYSKPSPEGVIAHPQWVGDRPIWGSLWPSFSLARRYQLGLESLNCCRVRSYDAYNWTLARSTTPEYPHAPSPQLDDTTTDDSLQQLESAVVTEADYRDIRLSITPPFARITIQSDAENWLRSSTLAELNSALTSVHANGEISFLIIESGVPGIFSYGCDVTTQEDTVDAESLLGEYLRVAKTLLELRPLSIAKIDGVCVGGGFEFSLLCTLSYASDSSLFRLPEILVGCLPPIAAAVYPAVVGYPTALDHLLTARKLTAIEAKSAKALSDVFPSASFERDFSERMEGLRVALSYPDTVALLKSVCDRKRAQDMKARIADLSKRLPTPSAARAALQAVDGLRGHSEVVDAFWEGIDSAMDGYKKLVESGVIEAGIQKYWLKKQNRIIRTTPQSFDVARLRAS